MPALLETSHFLEKQRSRKKAGREVLLPQEKGQGQQSWAAVRDTSRKGGSGWEPHFPGRAWSCASAGARGGTTAKTLCLRAHGGQAGRRVREALAMQRGSFVLSHRLRAFGVKAMRARRWSSLQRRPLLEAARLSDPQNAADTKAWGCRAAEGRGRQPRSGASLLDSAAALVTL